MKRSHFAPDDFEITADRLQWAMDTFKITKAEVGRQTELWHEYEYVRVYSDWNRAWKRWFRMAQKYETLKRPLKARQAEQGRNQPAHGAAHPEHRPTQIDQPKQQRRLVAVRQAVEMRD